MASLSSRRAWLCGIFFRFGMISSRTEAQLLAPFYLVLFEGAGCPESVFEQLANTLLRGLCLHRFNSSVGNNTHNNCSKYSQVFLCGYKTAS